MRSITAALVAGLLVSALLVGGVLAAGTDPSTTTIDPVSGLPGVDIPVGVTVTGAGTTPTGTVELYDVTGGGNTLLDNAVLDGAGEVQLTFPAAPAGTYDIDARYLGDDTYDVSEGGEQFTLTLEPSQTTLTSSHTTIQTHHAVTLTAEVSAAGAPLSGSVTFRRSLNGGAPVSLGSVAISGSSPQTVTKVVPSLPVGNVTITATWGGNTTFEGSTSDPVAITVRPDTVQATGIGVSLTTFYPVRDGYRDAVAARGTRQEPISVGIRIYASSGRLVRTASFQRRTGAYGFAWNGRNNGGVLQSPGRYRIVQTLRDAAGTTKVVAKFVTLSHKRLFFRSTTLTKTVNQASRESASAIAWQFTMPAATVYRSIRVGIYGYAPVGTPGLAFGPQDFDQCGPRTWDVRCVNRIGSIGGAVQWYSRRANTVLDRNGRYVRVYAWARPGGSGAVARARVVVTYWVLR
jgi:hypothetical protein